MAYRNKAYVIFDGDKDMWAYAYMLGWNKNDNMEFNFHDAHDLNTITNLSSEENTKRKLRERLATAKQAIVLVGESTKNLFKFVRWEIEECQKLGLPIIVVNLNKARRYDPDRCPAILRDANTMHVSFNANIIKYALDDFCENYAAYKAKTPNTNWYYIDDVYKKLGL